MSNIDKRALTDEEINKAFAGTSLRRNHNNHESECQVASPDEIESTYPRMRLHCIILNSD